jgi:ATP-binding cassette subfamily E protein 1
LCRKIHFTSILDNLDSTAYVFIICINFTDLKNIRDRSIDALSGGELQRFACAMVCIQDADIFMFDEPSSYLDVKQRLNAAVTIRSLIHPDK